MARRVDSCRLRRGLQVQAGAGGAWVQVPVGEWARGDSTSEARVAGPADGLGAQKGRRQLSLLLRVHS